jgi:RNA polymerase sigma-70 factor (ECF subfamily)
MQLPENQGNEFDYRPAYANGMTTALLFRRSTGDLDSMSYVVWEATGIARLLYVRNPDKLHIRGVVPH